MAGTNLKIERDFKLLKPATEWAFADAGRSETNYISHGYHRYPAKFIPNIVAKLIDDYTKPGDVVVDPFGGCGTTLVEAKVHGRQSYGFDINPVAKLITQTKTTAIYPKTLEHSLQKFLAHYGSSTPRTLTIRNERLKYWFDDVAIEELGKLYSSIKAIKDRNVQRFYFCAFSHILKNRSRWLMKSIKPQVDPQKTTLSSLDIFLHHLKFMMKKNERFYELLQKNRTSHTPATMRIANSTKRLPLKDNSIDLIVTSPPYVTSYEYADLHQLSLLWFGNDPHHFKKWSRHTEDFNGFRQKFVGTSLKKNQRRNDFKSAIAERIYVDLKPFDTSIANSVAHYFSDMHGAFSEMRRILKPGAKACIIIGNTSLYGVEILNAQVAAEQMASLGFKKVQFIKREVPNKMITPWRDTRTGKFTGKDNAAKKRAYEYEYVVVMEKLSQ